MSLPQQITSREQQKFVETAEGNVAVRIIGNFLDEVVGNKIEVAYPSSTVETYTFKNGATTYKVIAVTYTNASKDYISSVERTA